MGVSQTNYVFFGLMLDEDELSDIYERDEFFFENPILEEYEDGFQGLTLVVDGMSGEYLVFGYMLECGDEIDITSFSIRKIQELINDAKDDGLVDTFNRLFNTIKIEADLKLIVFTHYT